MRSLVTNAKLAIAGIILLPFVAVAAFILRVVDPRAEHAPLVEIPTELDDQTVVDVDGPS